MSEMSATVTVSSVRSRGKHGGVIFSGHSAKHGAIVAVVSKQVLPNSDLLNKGQMWRITGTVTTQSRKIENGGRLILINEKQMQCSEIEFLSPSSVNVVGYIADNPDIKGIGPAKARRLRDWFQDELIDVIRRGDLNALSAVINRDTAEALCEHFREVRTLESLEFLDKLGVSRQIGRKVVEFYGEDTKEKIQEDPYRLLPFVGSWKAVDDYAKQIGVPEDSNLRLSSVIEEALDRCFEDGHTVVPGDYLKPRIKSLLSEDNRTRALVNEALKLGEVSGNFYFDATCNEYHPAGALIMESLVASRLAAAINDSQSGLMAVDIEKTIADVIRCYENQENITLEPEQKQAIRVSATSNVSLIIGGAGTGKTTVLKGVYHAIDAIRPFAQIYQAALAGTAARRMLEATGRPSYTLAALSILCREEGLPDHSIVVIDESSMVDLLSIYRLVRYAPETTQWIFVGDDAQLRPVGPGEVLTALMESGNVPTTELKVNRRSLNEAIPRVANAVRAREWPKLSLFSWETEEDVSVLPCSKHQMNEEILQVYEALGGFEDPDSVMIACPTRQGPGGCDPLNFLINERVGNGKEPVRIFHEDFGVVPFKTKHGHLIKDGARIMFTKNDYSLDLRNGSIGVITRVETVTGLDDICCMADFDGRAVPLGINEIEHIDLGYAITVHKSQGSQADRVILPIRENRLLDRSMVYTAITRSRNQAVIIGDVDKAMAAVQNSQSRKRRFSGLSKLLMAAMKDKSGGV